MRTREYQLADLERARKLQKEAAGLHIPMPVMSWKYTVNDENGDIEEVGVGKANSYTRNALNILAWYLGFASSDIKSTAGFADGIISVKNAAGKIVEPYNGGRYSSTNAVIYLGAGSSESLDDYTVPSILTSTSVVSTFDATNRILITELVASYTNNTGAALSITEAGVRSQYSSGGANGYLAIHDIFDAISLDAGRTLTFTYMTEVAYPNP